MLLMTYILSIKYLVTINESDIKKLHTELLDYIKNTYDKQLKDNFTIEGEGQIRWYPIQQNPAPDFFIVGYFNFIRSHQQCIP